MSFKAEVFWQDGLIVVGGWLDFQDLFEAALDATGFLTTRDSKALPSLTFLVLYPPPRNTSGDEKSRIQTNLVQ